MQQTIRNTPDELAHLEPGLTAELQEVFDRYGLVVLGYSGSDEAIATIFAARRSRYGLHWVSRGELVEPARSIVEAGGGRAIVRAGSDEFLADLDLRLAVFEAHPSGLTPVTVNDQTTKLLEHGETVALAELLRRERREFEQRVESIIASRGQAQPTVGVAAELYDELLPVLERRLGSLLLLVLYRADLLAAEVDALADFKGRQPPRSGYSFYPDLLDWCIWWLFFIIGAFAVRMRRIEALKPFFSVEVATRYDNSTEPLFTPFENDAAAGIGQAVAARHSQTRWIDAPWQVLIEEAYQLQLLTERYPELASSQEEFKRALVEFDFVSTAVAALLGRRTFARWSMYGDLSRGFALRLRADQKLRGAIADVAGLPLSEFDARVANALQEIRKLGQFPEDGALAVLRVDQAT